MQHLLDFRLSRQKSRIVRLTRLSYAVELTAEVTNTLTTGLLEAIKLWSRFSQISSI
jgi:hypothetical protein